MEGVITFLLTTLLTFLGKFFFKRPKVTLTIQDDSAGSSTSEKPDHLHIRWYKYFVIRNLTKHSAYLIQFYNLPKNIRLDKKDNINLAGFEETKIKFSFFEDIEEQKVIQLKHNFVELLPEYFKKLSFGLEYINESKKTFYTYYQRKNSSEQNNFFLKKIYK